MDVKLVLYIQSYRNIKNILAGLVNDQLPRTFGDGVIHTSHVDAMVEGSRPIPELHRGELSEEEAKIGKIVADELVADGATLQMGTDPLMYNFG